MRCLKLWVQHMINTFIKFIQFFFHLTNLLILFIGRNIQRPINSTCDPIKRPENSIKTQILSQS